MCTTASQPMIGSVTLAAVPLVAEPGNNVIVVNAPAVKKKPGKKPASTPSSTASDTSSQTSESSGASSARTVASGTAALRQQAEQKAARARQNLDRFNTDFPQHGQLDTRSEPDLAMTSQSEKADLYWSKPNGGRYSQDDEHVTEFDADRAHNTVQRARAEDTSGFRARFLPPDTASPAESEQVDPTSFRAPPPSAKVRVSNLGPSVPSSPQHPTSSLEDRITMLKRSELPTPSGSRLSLGPDETDGDMRVFGDNVPAPKGLSMQIARERGLRAGIDEMDSPRDSESADEPSDSGIPDDASSTSSRNSAASSLVPSPRDGGAATTMTTEEMPTTRGATSRPRPRKLKEEIAYWKDRGLDLRKIMAPTPWNDSSVEPRWRLFSDSRSEGSDDDYIGPFGGPLDETDLGASDDDMPPADVEPLRPTLPPMVPPLALGQNADHTLLSDISALTPQSAATGTLDLRADTGASSSPFAAALPLFVKAPAPGTLLRLAAERHALEARYQELEDRKSVGAQTDDIKAQQRQLEAQYVEKNGAMVATVQHQLSASYPGFKSLDTHRYALSDAQVVLERKAKASNDDLIGAYNILKMHAEAAAMGFNTGINLKDSEDPSLKALMALEQELNDRQVKPCTAADQDGCDNLMNYFYPIHQAV